MLGHIYNKELADARMLWKRLPALAKANDAVSEIQEGLEAVLKSIVGQAASGILDFVTAAHARDLILLHNV